MTRRGVLKERPFPRQTEAYIYPFLIRKLDYLPQLERYKICMNQSKFNLNHFFSRARTHACAHTHILCKIEAVIFFLFYIFLDNPNLCFHSCSIWVMRNGQSAKSIINFNQLEIQNCDICCQICNFFAYQVSLSYCQAIFSFSGFSLLLGLFLCLIFDREKLNSMNLLLYMSPIAILVLLPAALIMEPNVVDVTLSLGREHKYMWLLLLVNSVMAYSANLSNFLVTKHTSALTLQVLTSFSFFFS